MTETAMYDTSGNFIGHSIEVQHHTAGTRAWCLEGMSEWCYPSSPCDSCQRARMGDPWEMIQRVRELHSPRPNAVVTCDGCDGKQHWPCATIRALDAIEDWQDVNDNPLPFDMQQAEAALARVREIEPVQIDDNAPPWVAPPWAVDEARGWNKALDEVRRALDGTE